MNAPIVEATIKAHLTDMRAKLEKGFKDRQGGRGLRAVRENQKRHGSRPQPRANRLRAEHPS
jgi:hypothetical protein